MESLEKPVPALVVTDVETSSAVQIFCTGSASTVAIGLSAEKLGDITFTLSREDFASYVEFLSFNQIRLAATFKQPDGQYVGLSKRRDNSITVMEFEIGESLKGEAYTFALEQNDVITLTEYMTSILESN